MCNQIKELSYNINVATKILFQDKSVGLLLQLLFQIVTIKIQLVRLKLSVCHGNKYCGFHSICK